MKTISTKLTESDFDKFLEMCNHDGQCISEGIRDLVKMGIEAYEEGLELEESEIVEPISEEPRPMAHGKILDDDGNIIATF